MRLATKKFGKVTRLMSRMICKIQESLLLKFMNGKKNEL